MPPQWPHSGDSLAQPAVARELGDGADGDDTADNDNNNNNNKATTKPLTSKSISASQEGRTAAAANSISREMRVNAPPGA